MSGGWELTNRAPLWGCHNGRWWIRKTRPTTSIHYGSSGTYLPVKE